MKSSPSNGSLTPDTHATVSMCAGCSPNSSAAMAPITRSPVIRRPSQYTIAVTPRCASTVLRCQPSGCKPNSAWFSRSQIRNSGR